MEIFNSYVFFFWRLYKYFKLCTQDATLDSKLCWQSFSNFKLREEFHHPTLELEAMFISVFLPSSFFQYTCAGFLTARRPQNAPPFCTCWLEENKGAWHFVTASNEVAVRLCFYTCLWFCSQGGGGLCPGVVSVRGGSLSRGKYTLCPRGSLSRVVSVRDPTVRLHAGGTHPTGMHSC